MLEISNIAKKAAAKLPPDVLMHPMPFPDRLDYAEKIIQEAIYIEMENGRQWNALLELELANLRSIKPICYVCEQLMEQRGEDATDYICVNCDRAYREAINERNELRRELAEIISGIDRFLNSCESEGVTIPFVPCEILLATLKTKIESAKVLVKIDHQ